ncbi:MAG: hypothetical protein U0Q16_14325 [Bryobacteraceae bacterium]
MGLEARCNVTYKSAVSEGRLQLESDALRFRGGVRLDIPTAAIKKAEAKGTDLVVTWQDERAVFSLGPAAAKWADKITNPPSRLDKLGIKAGTRLCLAGKFPEDFVTEAGKRTEDVSIGKPKSDSAAILLLAESAAQLDKIAKLRGSLAPDGALWIVYPKGQPDITQSMVFDAAHAANLVDVKVASFSITHTALKFVIPVQERASKAK